MKHFALWWNREYRLDQPMRYMSRVKAGEMNAALARQGIVNLRWLETDLRTSELVNEWTELDNGM